MAVLANSLTTLANAKAIAGISGTTYDATFELLINRVSAIIRRHLGRELSRGTYTEKLPGTGRQLLVMKEWPIISVTSIKISDMLLALNTDYRIDDQDKEAGLIYRENGWRTVDLVTGLTQDVVAGSRDIDVVYVAGYYMPADALYVEGATTALPVGFQQAVDEMVARRFQKTRRQGFGLTSYSEGGIAFGFKGGADSTIFGLDDDEAMILEGYKRGAAIA